MRLKSLTLAAVALAAIPAAQAISFSDTIGEFNGDLHNGGFPIPAVTVGTFVFDLMGGTAITAAISGTWGNSQVPNSAATELYLDGILVATLLTTDPGYSSQTPTGWSYTLTGSELDILNDGEATLTAVQTSPLFIRLGESTLRGTAAPGGVVPGPAAVLAFIGPLLVRRRNRK